MQQIVGVAGDARLRRAFEPAPDAIYLPLSTAPSWATVHVRFDGPAQPVADALRAAVREADPAMPVFDMMTVRDAVARQMSEEMLIGRLTLTFAVIATLLAAVGLYGVLAQAVAERRVEIGIRAALGAAPGRVLRLVTGDALRMTATGAAVGVALSLWLTRYLESRLYGVERLDVPAFAAALAVVTVASLAAAAIPAAGAARVDPVTALRQ
jgi:ABC-type antimicrobial peptide transport system permease subunit